MPDFIRAKSKMNESGFVDATWNDLVNSRGDMVPPKRKKYVYLNRKKGVVAPPEKIEKMQRPAASYSNTQWGDITENDL